jgi:DNA polymerase III alpha subunit
LDKVPAESSADIQQYNQSNKKFDLELPEIVEFQEIDLSMEEFDSLIQHNWFMPEEYKTMDIEGFLVNQCPKEHYQRLIEELQEFRARNMIDLLKFLKYFVDTCRSENIVWGVGRGSSVASYALFLLGVHKIDSVKYKLDWREFLR